MAAHEYNIVVLGSSEAGKTSFIEKYTKDELSEAYQPTAHALFTKEIMVDSKPVKLMVHDIGGDAPADVPKDDFIKKADGIFIVYDITKGDTFNALKDIKKHITDVSAGKNIPLVLVGTKADLEDMRDVADAKATEFANELHCMLFETSAINGTNVEASFLKIVSLIMEMSKPARAQSVAKVEKKKGCCILQ